MLTPLQLLHICYDLTGTQAVLVVGGLLSGQGYVPTGAKACALEARVQR